MAVGCRHNARRNYKTSSEAHIITNTWKIIWKYTRLCKYFDRHTMKTQQSFRNYLPSVSCTYNRELYACLMKLSISWYNNDVWLCSSYLSAACSACLLAWWTFCRATLLMIKPGTFQCSVLSRHMQFELKHRNQHIKRHHNPTLDCLHSSFGESYPLCYVLSLVWAAATSATLLSKARLNL